MNRLDMIMLIYMSKLKIIIRFLLFICGIQIIKMNCPNSHKIKPLRLKYIVVPREKGGKRGKGFLSILLWH